MTVRNSSRARGVGSAREIPEDKIGCLPPNLFASVHTHTVTRSLTSLLTINMSDFELIFFMFRTLIVKFEDASNALVFTELGV